MKKLFFLVKILILLISYSYGQKKEGNDGLVQLKGILFFEKEQNVYTGYFIESSFTNLSSLLKKSDTVEVFIIGSPGDDQSNIVDFKTHLDKTIQFESLSLLVQQENYQGQQYEDTVMTYSKNGCIRYVKGKKYQLSRNYKKVSLNNRIIIFVLKEYIPIESFVVKKNSAIRSL